MDFDINWLAVIVGVVVHQGLGALWYGMLFKDTWLRAMGMTSEDVQRQGPGPEIAIGTIASVVSVIALALLLTLLDDPALADGLAIGAVCGIGFVAAATFMNGAYEQKKPVLSALFGAYYTVGLALAGAILAAWQ